jgi:hypothetical protein
VEIDTSGAKVTTRSPTSVRASDDSTRPNASWVDDGRLPTAPVTRSGTVNRGTGASSNRWRRSAVLAHSRPALVLGANGSHSVSRSSPHAARNSVICSADMIAEWFIGSPANGRPQPFTV